VSLGERQFKDLFSKESSKYAAARPTYPKSLFDFLATLVEQRELAWDCATGNGQAAVMLSGYFKQVIASDASAKQIENAEKRSNVSYKVFPAEKTTLENGSIDLITVAQSLHWFNFGEFYKEAKRVMKKNAVIAAWAYGLHVVSPEVDKVTHELYEGILGKYWPEERKYIERRYEDIPFPFKQIPGPQFKIELRWNLPELVNYIYTWSSVQKFIEQNGSDPVKQIYGDLEQAWGKAQQKKSVAWPIYTKIGRA
jgi:hypothetical protein